MRPISPLGESSRTSAHPWRGCSTSSARTACSPSEGSRFPPTRYDVMDCAEAPSRREDADVSWLDRGPDGIASGQGELFECAGCDLRDEWDITDEANSDALTEAVDRIDVSSNDVAGAAARPAGVQRDRAGVDHDQRRSGTGFRNDQVR